MRHSHDQRVGLDGAPAELIDAQAKDLAAKQLSRLAAAKAAKKDAKAVAMWRLAARVQQPAA